MSLSKRDLLAALPRTRGELRLRAWQREDIDRWGIWPNYPFPYESFSMPPAGTPEDGDAFFRRIEDHANKLNLAADHPHEPAVAFVGFYSLDWEARSIGNMSYRLHPAWCDRGLGTEIMRLVCDWAFGSGMESIRFEVQAQNGRAIRCYEKLGFVRTCETWQPLAPEDLTPARHEVLEPHLRWRGDIPELRMWWMERRGPARAP